jgi:putative SOS response-associated peptidase YedK
MCGRYASKDQAAIERFWNLPRGGGDFFGARYNAAPTQRLPTLQIRPEHGPELAQLRWGLIPSCAKDAANGSKMINARAKTVTSKPAFRAAFKRRRCLVPMAGFYEWQETPAGCKECDRAAHDPAFSNPMHLVHPEHGKFMVFDIYGMAVCPTCSAIWYRDHKGTVLLNERKPPKRAMPVPVKGRKPAKWVTGGNRT